MLDFHFVIRHFLTLPGHRKRRLPIASRFLCAMLVHAIVIRINTTLQQELQGFLAWKMRPGEARHWASMDQSDLWLGFKLVPVLYLYFKLTLHLKKAGCFAFFFFPVVVFFRKLAIWWHMNAHNKAVGGRPTLPMCRVLIRFMSPIILFNTG